jgi:hypothetical protein
MQMAEIRALLARLDRAEENHDGDEIDNLREQCTDMLYKVASVVEQYEFLATHVSYMQVDFDWGGRDKIYNDRKTYNDFQASVRKSIEMNTPEEE